MMLMLKMVGLKGYQYWMRLTPAQRKAIRLYAKKQVKKQVKKHGPTVVQTVRDRGPVVVKRLSEGIRESRKKRQRRLNETRSRATPARRRFIVAGARARVLARR